MSPERLYAYLDGELTPDEAARVESAAASDSELAARLRELKLLDHALETLPGLQAGPDFTTRVVARIRRGRRIRIAAVFAPLAAAAAIAAALLLARVQSPAVRAFTQEDYLDYAWEADAETYEPLSLQDLQSQILEELGST